MRRSKYGATRTVVDGLTFASKAEAQRYSELKLLVRAGEIKDLRLQPKYPVSIDGVKVFTYIGDFEYRLPNGSPVLEDVKGYQTAIFRLKRKCVEAFYPGLKIVLVKGRVAA